MDEELCAALTRAVLVMASGAAGGEERRAATQFVEEVKAGSAQAEMLGVRLALASAHGGGETAETQATLRLFGLQLLEHCIRTRWNAYSAGQKDELKQMLLRVLLADTRPLGAEPAFIKLKIGRVVAEAAKREWPQHWPSLVDDLMALSRADDTRCDLVFVVFQVLVEDVMEFDGDLPADRRRDLRLALADCAPTLLDGVAAGLQTAAAAAGGAGGGAVLAAPHPMFVFASTCLQLLTAMAGWVPLALLYERNLLLVLCSYLAIPALRLGACACLALVYDRKGPREERETLLHILPHLPQLMQCLPAPTALPMGEDDAHFTLRLSELVLKIGVTQVCAMWSPTLPALDMLARALLQLAQHPSLLVLANALTVWAALFRQPHAMQSCLAEQLQPVLEIGVLRVRKPPYLPAYSGPDAELHFVQRDFATRREYDNHFAAVRNQIMTLVRLLSSLSPSLCLSLALQCLVSVLQPVLAGAAGGEGSGSNAVVQPASFNSVAIFVESVIHGVLLSFTSTTFGTLDEPTRAALSVQLAQCLEGLLSLRVAPSDHALLKGRLALFQALFPFLEQRGEYLGGVLEAIFAAMEHGEADRSNEGIQLRRVAGAALISLCQKAPPRLGDYLMEIMRRVQLAMAKPDTSDNNKRMMLEALVAAGNVIPSIDAHHAFLAQLLSPALADWSSPELLRAVGSEAGLVDFAALHAVGSEAARQREQLSNAVAAVLSVARCTRPRDPSTLQVCEPTSAPSLKLNGLGGCAAGGDGLLHPSRDLVLLVFDKMCALTRALHRLWLEPPASLVPAVLDLRASELELLVGSGEPVGDAMSAGERWVDVARYWLGSLRESCYAFLGNCCKLGVIYEQAALPELACVADLGRMHLRHQRSYVKFVLGSLVLYAPRDILRFRALEPTLAAIYQHYLRLFSAVWQARRVASVESINSGGGGDSTAVLALFGSEGAQLPGDLRETALGKLFDELVHDVLIHCTMVFASAADAHGSGEDGPAAGGGGHEPHPHTLGPLALFVLNSSLAVPVLSLFAECIVSPNFAACRLASEVLAAILPTLAQYPALEPFLTDMLLRATLRGLSVHGQHADCETHLLNLLSFLLCHHGAQAGVAAIVLEAVPGLTPAALQGLVKFLRDRMHGKGASGKQRRQEIRKHFAGVIGVNVGQQLRIKTEIRSLETPLSLPSRGSKMSAQGIDVVESGSAALDALFGGGED